MSKARTEAELADQQDSDLTWRLRELSDLKAAIANAIGAPPIPGDHALRSLRKHQYNELEKQLYINKFLKIRKIYRTD